MSAWNCSELYRGLLILKFYCFECRPSNELANNNSMIVEIWAIDLSKNRLFCRRFLIIFLHRKSGHMLLAVRAMFLVYWLCSLCRSIKFVVGNWHPILFRLGQSSERSLALCILCNTFIVDCSTGQPVMSYFIIGISHFSWHSWILIGVHGTSSVYRLHGLKYDTETVSIATEECLDQ